MDDDVLPATARDVAGEPLLGPRQSSLVYGVTWRLCYGPPLTSTDLVALAWAGRILGLPLSVPTSPGAP